MVKDIQINVRIDSKLADRLDRATDKARNPVAPTKAAIITWGIELALKELERREGKKR